MCYFGRDARLQHKVDGVQIVVIANSQPPALHPVDVYVGNRLRAARKGKDMSQSELAQALGMSFQQVQKYEKGVNRLSASVMMEACQALHIRPESLFPDMKEGEATLLTTQIDAYPGGTELAGHYAKMSTRCRRLLLALAEIFNEDDELRPSDH
ncbi:MAG: XRE family transcriptional regulator [Alphaproteobacteria bacterium]|nr:MAG: XRE family transcriptional regulator [Alphaproteobacteria bacterium]